jgi:hypothetical protein
MRFDENDPADRQAFDEASKVRIGDTVKVVRGRKVPLGFVGQVTWIGDRGYGESVRISPENGEVKFTSTRNVEVVHPDFVGPGDWVEYLESLKPQPTGLLHKGSLVRTRDGLEGKVFWTDGVRVGFDTGGTAPHNNQWVDIMDCDVLGPDGFSAPAAVKLRFRGLHEADTKFWGAQPAPFNKTKYLRKCEGKGYEALTSTLERIFILPDLKGAK